MSPLVHIVMFAWIPVVIGLFSRLKPRHAVIASILIAWLFLPNAEYSIPGFPNYNKMSATCLGILMAAAMFDLENLSRFRLRALDIPLIVWCLCPLASSLANGYGLYDGLSGVFRQTVTWGFPYLIGRVYFNNLEGLKELALGIFIGGMIYVPLCLYESRMSPQLHYQLYGFYQHSFAQTYRWGGWRPMVFMSHGLMVGAWMMSASLIGVWLYKAGVLKNFRGVPASLMLVLLLATTVWCKSLAAIGLMLAGMGILLLSSRFGKPLFLILLVAVPLFYIPARATGAWSEEGLISFIEEHISQQRAESLEYRMGNETILAEKAMQRPIFGWGTWGKARVYDEQGRDISVTDGLWIIALGNHGLVGLMSLTLSILMPVFLLLRTCPARYWAHPRIAPVAVLSVLLGLYMVDNLLNAMINPVFMLAAGGIAGLTQLSAPVGEPLPAAGKTPAARLAYAPRFL